MNLSQQFLFSQVFIYAIAALSVTMLTGWAGQLSLGKFALVGLGAMSTVALSASVPFLVAVGLAGMVGRSWPRSSGPRRFGSRGSS